MWSRSKEWTQLNLPWSSFVRSTFIIHIRNTTCKCMDLSSHVSYFPHRLIYELEFCNSSIWGNEGITPLGTSLLWVLLPMPLFISVYSADSYTFLLWTLNTCREVTKKCPFALLQEKKDLLSSHSVLAMGYSFRYIAIIKLNPSFTTGQHL